VLMVLLTVIAHRDLASLWDQTEGDPASRSRSAA